MQKVPFVTGYLTEHFGDDDYATLDGYRRRGGYETAKKALTEMSAEQIVERIHAHPITIRRKAADDGRLHGSVTTQNVVDLVRQEIGVELERKQIELHEPIRHIGGFLLTVHPHPDVKGELSLTVVSDSAPIEKATAEEAAPADVSAEAESGEVEEPVEVEESAE